MTWVDFAFTGIPVVDAILNIVLKVIFGILAVYVAINALKFYRNGSYGQLGVSVAIGLLLLGGMLGFSNVVLAAQNLQDLFKNAASGTTGSGSGKGI